MTANNRQESDVSGASSPQASDHRAHRLHDVGAYDRVQTNSLLFGAA